jgi:hypothetical protein
MDELAKEALAEAFHEELLFAAERAKNEVHYNPTRFLQMLANHGGVQTARLLINAPRESEGYSKLWVEKRLDLSVEAIVHDHARWHPLFTKEELEKCTKRLADFDYPRKSV